jgi:hypothetical protein
MLTFPQIQAIGNIKSDNDSLGFPAVLKYLRDRGIDSSLIDDLGFQILPAGEMIKRSRGTASMDDRLAVVMPHFNVAGDYIDWWSARLVDTGLRPVVASFAALVPHKRGKMYCPPNEPPHAYLPPILNWRELAKCDRIYIHESVIKAVNGARLGRWSVGLNGVWGWGSKKHGQGLVAELRDLPWRALELRPTIVFDSNALDNWDVQAAISQLAAKLLEITGRHAEHLLLPKADGGGHWGFDDLCVAWGDDRARAYLDGDGVAVEISEVQLLKNKLNAEVVVVRSLGVVADQQSGTLMRRNVFTDVTYAHYLANVEKKNGDITQVNVPKLWLMDDKRASVEKITYMPGQGRIENNELNLWTGMGCEPVEGDVDRWLKLLEHGLPDERIRKWFIQWMAYPVQHLGAKLHSYVHLWGPGGSGKQAAIAPLMLIYGNDNSVVIGRDDIASSFNSIYANKQFINVDEIHKADTRMGGDETVNNTLKRLVTWPEFVVKRKQDPEYRIPNVCQIVTTSNYPDSIKLDDDDRRCAVLRFGVKGSNLPKEWWTEYFKWLEEEGGAEAVYHYLLGVDMAGFNPKGDAPLTDDKREMIRAGHRVDEQWVNELWDDPDQCLPPILAGRALMSNDELATLCYGEDQGGVTPGKRNALGIRMHAAGFQKRQIKFKGKVQRFWIVRERGRAWTSGDCQAHLRMFKMAGDDESEATD